MPADENNTPDVEMIPDGETDDTEPVAKIKKLRGELRKCETERRDYLDGWQRAKAELANYKKDEAKRFDACIKFAAEGVMAEVVQVLDSFDLALQHEMPRELERGIVLIRSQLEDILRRRGLEVLETKGQRFNPAFHESVGEVESDGEEGIVTDELQKGYLLEGKVLRPARVKISRLRRQTPDADH